MHIRLQLGGNLLLFHGRLVHLPNFTNLLHAYAAHRICLSAFGFLHQASMVNSGWFTENVAEYFSAIAAVV